MKTVIIPFYGSNPSRLGCLEKCLEHLLNQKGNFDVLIIYATRDGEFRINKVIEKIEILPYHTLGQYKYEELGLEYKLKDVEPPAEIEIGKAKKILEASCKKVSVR